MNDITTEVSELADLGLRVFPCRPLDKRPQITAWPTEATCEFPEHWFSGGSNLAIRCGRTDTEVSIFVVDIDIKDDAPGKESWAQFCRQHPEVREQAQLTASVSTPSGGWHFYFAVPEGFDLPTNGKPWPGVDIRGEGGYVLAPPSKLPNGEYTWVRTIAEDGIMWAPPALMEAVLTPPRAEPTPAPTVQSPLADGDNPLDWANENLDPRDGLASIGWQYAHSKGQDQFWVRPGKNMRDGHSAVIHDDGTVVIWTTDLPLGWSQLGKTGADGSVVLTPFDVFCAVQHDCDVKAAMGDIRRNRMPHREAVDIGSLVPTSTAVTVQGEVHVTEPSGLNLPDEFWSARPILTHIRDAAWSMSTSPDAVFAALMTRFAANLHPSIMLPEWGTLDVFVVIAGHSGGYKSKASKTARMLFGGQFESDVMMDRQVGSGEGLAEAFFEWRDEDGNPCSATKKGARKVKTKWGLHFATDEGTAFTSSAGRMGSILIPTLCSAWMGESIGQMLADPTKSRMIEPHAVRVCAEVKIQTVNGYKLFDEVYEGIGLSQRMICFSSLDPTIKARFEAGEPRPEWPGPIEFEFPTLTRRGVDYDPKVLKLASTIQAHLDRASAIGHDYDFKGDPLDTHANLSRLKLAGIMALWEGRDEVLVEDWELAGTVLDSSRRIRTVLKATKSKADRDAGHSRALARAEAEVVVDDAKHKALVRRTVSVLQARIEAGKPLGKKHISAPQRDVYEEAVDILEAQGLIER